MQAFSENLLSSLASTQSEDEVFNMLLSAAKSLGFDYCAYGFKFQLPATNPKILIRSNYPDNWQARYREAGYLAIDPTVHHCLRTTSPIIWSDSVFSSAKRLWFEARECGLRVGWAQAVADAAGRGMFSLSRSSEPLTVKELLDIGEKMHWLVQASHVTLSLRMKSQTSHSAVDLLTLREIEVLKWSADGKTASEISEILSISLPTVKFHLKNSIVKLNTANKTAAVVKALFLGLLN